MQATKRILYTATSDIHLRTFHFPYLHWLIQNGYEVHVAVEKRGDVDLSFCHRVHFLPFKRSPFDPNNVKAFVGLKKIIRSVHFDIIHCHTPAVSVITRIAAIAARRKGTKVFYTAHGFHFYKGAPLKFWFIFYPLEKILSVVSDVIITINKEDFMLVKERFWNKETYQLKGIGVDTKKFKTLDRQARTHKRKQLDIPEDAFVVLYVAEFIDRKNHAFLLRNVSALKKRIPNLLILLAGRGELLNKSMELAATLRLTDEVRFLGWRNDVPDLAAVSDVGISTSKQEGLGLGLAEEMLCSVPVVATEDRGHREMIEHGVNGFMFAQEDDQSFISCITALYEDNNLRERFGVNAYHKALEFRIENSLHDMGNIYQCHTL
ncbi:MAG TPA: glycosyltransferase family 4 protein [Chryseosolibacter sp.]